MTQDYKTHPEQADMARTEARIRVASTLGLVLFIVIVGLSQLVLPAFMSFPEAMADRLAFAARTSAVVLFCVVVAIGMVSIGRRQSSADVGGSAAGLPSERIAIRVAFLQNTLEQAVIAVGFYFAFASLASGAWLSVLPVSAAFFVVGRVLFLKGYAEGAAGRAWGMVITMIPVILGYPLVFILTALRWF